MHTLSYGRAAIHLTGARLFPRFDRLAPRIVLDCLNKNRECYNNSELILICLIPTGRPRNYVQCYVKINNNYSMLQ